MYGLTTGTDKKDNAEFVQLTGLTKATSKEDISAFLDQQKRAGRVNHDYVAYYMFGSHATPEATEIATQVKKAMHSALVPYGNVFRQMVDGDNGFGIDPEKLEAGDFDARRRLAEISRNTIMHIFIVAVDVEKKTVIFDEKELERCRKAHEKLQAGPKQFVQGVQYASFKGKGLDAAYLNFAGLQLLNEKVLKEQGDRYDDERKKYTAILPAYAVVYVWVPEGTDPKVMLPLYKQISPVNGRDPPEKSSLDLFNWKEFRHVLDTHLGRARKFVFVPWINKAGKIVFPLQEDSKPKRTYLDKLGRKNPFDGDADFGWPVYAAFYQNQLCAEALRREMAERKELLETPFVEEDFQSRIMDNPVMAFACKYCGGKGTAGADGTMCAYCGGKKVSSSKQAKSLRQLLLKNP